MEFGLFSVGDLTPDPVSNTIVTPTERLQSMARVARHAEDIGLDVYALGEHHNPPFLSSSTSTVLAFIAAHTARITLSTSTTLITTNDPVKIAEDFATLQHLAGPRVDLMLGRGNTPEVYPWFGQNIGDGIALAVENYGLLRRLWDEEIVDWHGRFRSPLRGFTAMPRPLQGRPTFVWHGSVRSPEIVEQAARYGDGFFVNNLFMGLDYFSRYVQHYRDRFATHGHGTREQAVVGIGGGLHLATTSQAARAGYAPYFHTTPANAGAPYEQTLHRTGMTVGSPQQVIDKLLTFPNRFGPYRRQLFGMDFGGLPEASLHAQLDLLGSHVLPVLRREMPEPPARDAPAHHAA